ncbi:branchpoint-bridging protein [Apiospora saccharicola]|uniref:Branchpoint-bridging protein n=1 Tax=Apiospora saccharicola TaxID=335842 RepID=A0ABR1U8H8_9PEZI
MAAQSIRRPTRWNPEGMAPRLPHLTTAVTGPMTSEQIEAYAQLVRIEELQQLLLTDTVLPTNEFRRCPSPPPEYDASGVRTNTRQRRYRTALEDEYHGLVQRASRTLPNYRLPRGYVPRSTRTSKVTDKVYIPTKEYPWINFIGQLLGPRGRSLADMNTQSGANIVIRGKGSVKEGRARRPNHGRIAKEGIMDDSHEPLHCLITADTRDKVDRAKALVQDVIERAATTPEYANTHKKQQLRDLAMANGTFRDDEAHGHAGRLLTLPVDDTSTTTHPAPTTVIPPWRRAVGPAHSQEPGQSNVLDIEYRRFEAEMNSWANS